MKSFRGSIRKGQRGSSRDGLDSSSRIEAGANPDSSSGDVMDYNSFPSGSGLLASLSSNIQQTGESEDNPSLPKDYRGFNTSIADMWRYPEQERIDCCSIALCGCLQADRDRYLLSGRKPPTCFRRVFVHCMMPFIIFGLAIFAAVNVPDPYLNQLLCYGFVLAFIMYFFSQCLKGAWKRRQVRRNLLWAKYHKDGSGYFQRGEDHDSDDDEPFVGSDEEYLMGQTRGDIWNAHTLCGCYATDRGRDFKFGAEEEITFCTRIFDCFTNVCCAKVCGMHLLLCGFCGTAQEGRQIQALLDPALIHIDYITMQPMMEYYPAIYEARHSDERPKTKWYNRLSSLSKWTAINSLICLVLFFIWSLLSRGLNHKFGPKNFLVFLLTLLQAFILLALVYRNHTKDVSIDALIKFFATGFCLSTTLGIFFEMLIGLVIRLFMGLLMAISGVDVVQENGYSMSMADSGVSNYVSGQEVNYKYVGVDYRSYVEAFGNDHPIIYTIYLFVTAFVLAALIEELCKYFGYRMVDHPDFHSREEIEEAMRGREEDGIQHTITSFDNQDRSFQSRGAAITVSMVAVGVGFACCENLIYIFVYGKATVATEVFILLARSLFPIHPIAAALQSIGVCKRDVERDPKTRLGRVVLPSILFHGLYDFSVTWLYYMANRKGNFVDKYNIAETISSVVSSLTLVVGLCYYFREARKQRQRLAEMDGEATIGASLLT